MAHQSDQSDQSDSPNFGESDWSDWSEWSDWLESDDANEYHEARSEWSDWQESDDEEVLVEVSEPEMMVTDEWSLTGENDSVQVNEGLTEVTEEWLEWHESDDLSEYDERVGTINIRNSCRAKKRAKSNP